MAKVSFRTSDERKKSLDEIAHEYGMTKTDICNDALRVWFKMHDEDLPEHLEKDTRHEDIVERNRHKMRRMRFKQRVHEKLVSFLEDDRGNERKFPPEPDKVEEEYFESLREEVDREYEKYRDEYMDFLDQQLEWYKMRHPSHKLADGKGKEECIRLVAEQLEQGRDDFAAELAGKLADELKERDRDATPSGLVKEAHKLREQDRWRDDWNEAVRGEGGEKA